MAKFIVKSKNKVVQEFEIKGEVKIGREAGDIVLKNPAVSATHARLTVENKHYIMHDLDSTNGTFVNKGRVASQELHHGDVVNIGKFQLEFINQEEKKSASDNFYDEAGGQTVMINAKDLMRSDKDKKESKAARLWQIRPSGDSGKVEHKLKKETLLLGSGENVDIHLKGFTIGNVAVSIRRSDGRYFIKFLGGFSKLKVNGEKLSKERELNPKDKIEIGSYLFEFIP